MGFLRGFRRCERKGIYGVGMGMGMGMAFVHQTHISVS